MVWGLPSCLLEQFHLKPGRLGFPFFLANKEEESPSSPRFYFFLGEPVGEVGGAHGVEEERKPLGLLSLQLILKSRAG